MGYIGSCSRGKKEIHVVHCNSGFVVQVLNDAKLKKNSRHSIDNIARLTSLADGHIEYLIGKRKLFDIFYRFET